MFQLLLLCMLGLFTALDALIEGDIALPSSSRQGDVRDSFLLAPSQLWSNGIVPYRFETLVLAEGVEEPIFRAEDMQLLREAMEHISAQVPCIHFR